MMAYMNSGYKKKFTPIHNRLTLQLSKYLQETSLTEWMTKEEIIQMQKDLPVYEEIIPATTNR